MGRKIEIEKIDDATKCQVTFSKRRTSLIRKAHEIAVCCDVDVAFIAFSPSGRITKYSNQKRIEDVIQRYVDLPIDMRLSQVSDSRGRIHQLRHLDHFSSDSSKLHFLDKQIENLELQIKKGELELQILEANLRDFELDPGEELSLHRLSWCERNLSNSLDKVVAAKTSLNGNDEIATTNLGFPGQLMMQLDPWISPYNNKVRENLIHNLVEQGASYYGRKDDQWTSDGYGYATTEDTQTQPLDHSYLESCDVQHQHANVSMFASNLQVPVSEIEFSLEGHILPAYPNPVFDMNPCSVAHFFDSGKASVDNSNIDARSNSPNAAFQVCSQAEMLFPPKLSYSSLWTSRAGDSNEWDTVFHDDSSIWFDSSKNELNQVLE